METKNLDIKLKTYSALAVGIFVTGAQVDAKVVYTDIIPDAIITTGNNYDLDLNNDATNDFRMFVASSSFVGIIGVSYNMVLGSNAVYPFALNQKDMISYNQSTWLKASSLIMMQTANGNWAGATDKYLGLKIVIKGQTHYGWARLDVDPTGTSITIKDYAYDDTPSQAITAGNTGGAVNIKENHLHNNISAYSYDNILFINLSNKTVDESIIKLYDLSGQEIKSFIATDINMEIDVKDIKESVYLLSIYNKEGVFSRKINIR